QTSPTFNPASPYFTESVGAGVARSGMNPGTSPQFSIGTPGTYYVFAQVDGGNTVAETNEGNNVIQSVGTITVTTNVPDLNWSGGGLIAPVPAAVNQGFPFRVQGNYRVDTLAPTANFTIGYYVSADTNFSNARFLGSTTISLPGDKTAGMLHPVT